MTAREIKKIKKFLGAHYSNKIIAHLNKCEILNADGNAYSSESIRQIVRNNQPNETVELAIFQLLKITAAKTAKLLKIKKEILKK